MINKNSFTKDWILNFKNEEKYKKCDPALIEKMIFALYLVECLVQEEINFIFKGGTSLALVLGDSNRFSVDVDILSTKTRKELEVTFEKITQSSEFHSFSLDTARSYENASIPKAHYFFYYNSNFNNNTSYILLDILFQENKYPKIQGVKIESNWLNTTNSSASVLIPTINSILGDKLTAFAPNTTGVPYFKHKELEIVKQLYDVALLIRKTNNLEYVYHSFRSIANDEITYRNLSIRCEDVLDDIIQTALLISLREKNEDKNLQKFNEIKLGITKFGSFIINGNFRIDDAIEASAKIAILAAKLKTHDFTPLVEFIEIIDIKDLQINQEGYIHLNKLKKSNKAAFFYWHQCIQIIHGKN